MNRILFPFAFLVLLASGVSSHAQQQQTRKLKFEKVKPEKQIKFRTYFSHIVVAPDGRWVAAGGHGILKIWDVKSGKMIARMGDKTPNFMGSHGHLLASPDGRFLVDAGILDNSTESVCLYDTQSWKLVRRISLKHVKKKRGYCALGSAAFSNDGRLALYTHAKVIEIYDPLKGKLLKTIDVKKHSLKARLGRIGFVQEGKKIACILGKSRFGVPPLEFDLIDIESGKREKWNKLPIIYKSEKCSFGRNCFVSVDSRGEGYYPLPKDTVKVKESIKPIQIPFSGKPDGISVSWDGKFIAAIDGSTKHGKGGRIQIWKATMTRAQ